MPTEETMMITALDKLEKALAASGHRSARRGAPPPAPSGTGVVSPVEYPSGDAGLAAPQGLAEFARKSMYLQGMPILTPERVQELEESLLTLIALLKSLHARPTTRMTLQDLIDALTQVPGLRDASEGDQFGGFVRVLANDVPAGGQRLAPVLIAAFMAGYMVAHTWGR
jgi:hypothetical protein